MKNNNYPSKYKAKTKADTKAGMVIRETSPFYGMTVRKHTEIINNNVVFSKYTI